MEQVDPLPLHNAITEYVMNDDELLAFLSRNKQEAKVKDANGNYPLYLACQYCFRSTYPRFLLALIKEFPDAINQQWENGNSNPLHLLCWFDKPNLLSSLLERNPNIINYHDELNRTPLQIACLMGSKDLVSIILRYPNIHVNNKDHDEETALHYAVLHHFGSLINTASLKINTANLKIIPLLLKYDGINVEVRNKKGQTPFVTYLELLSQTEIKCTPKNRKFKIIQLFMKCNPNVVYIMPPLSPSGAPIPFIHYLTRNGHTEVLRYILGCSTTPSDVINATFRNGQTAFHTAARDNKLKCLNVLMDSPLVDVSKKCDNGRTALHYACYYHCNDAFLCLENLPNIRMLMHGIDNLGDTPLHSVFRPLDSIGYESFQAYNYGNDLLIPSFTDTALWFLNEFMRINECLIFIKNKDGHTIREVIDAKLTIMESGSNNDIIKANIKGKLELLCTTCEGFEMKPRWKLYHYLLMNARLDGGYTLV